MRFISRPLVLSAMLYVAAGCAAGPPVASAPKFDPNLITRQQIQEIQVTTAYDAVKALRGSWLIVRGAQSFRYPSVIQVYLDDVRMGDVSSLSSISSPPIQYIRFFSGQEASAKWGIDHGAGAIYVSTKVGRGGAATPPGEGR